MFKNDKGNYVNMKPLIMIFFAIGIIVLFVGTAINPVSPKDTLEPLASSRGTASGKTILLVDIDWHSSFYI